MSDYTKENYQSILDCLIHTVRRASEMVATAYSWYQQHASSINTYLVAFTELSCWFSAVQIMAEAQIVFTDDLSFEFAYKICHSDSVAETVEQYYIENDNHIINCVIERCCQAKQTLAYSELLSQTISAYQAEHYHLACLGMLAIVDGALSDVSENQKTSYKIRLQEIEKKISEKFELTDLEKKIICIYVSIDNLEKSIFMNSNFSQIESDNFNRHWIVHGRTRREYTKLDFIKIILWLDAIIFLDDKLTNHEDNK